MSELLTALDSILTDLQYGNPPFNRRRPVGFDVVAFARQHGASIGTQTRESRMLVGRRGEEPFHVYIPRKPDDANWTRDSA